MPNASTELFGSSNYRGAVIENSLVGIAHVQIGLMVGCVNPSNHAGAQLQLQVANYSTTTHLNTSVFANIGVAILIDNSAFNPCPGFLAQDPASLLPPLSGTHNGWILRVMGSGGGGTGDNPQFQSVAVQLRDTGGAVAMMSMQSISTTGFTAFAYSWAYIAPAAGKIMNFDWIAVNSTVSVPTLESGTGTCTIIQGNFACSQVITFATAFVATPVVVGSITNVPTQAILPIGTVNLLSAEIVTV